MKHMSTIAMSVLIASILSTSTAFAASKYTEYREQVASQTSAASESRHIQADNKYIGMDEERSGSTEDGTSRTQSHNKYLDMRR